MSGCAGGVAVLWDLNRLRLVTKLPSMAPNDASSPGIAAIAINEMTGDIVVACGTRFGVYDVNGALLVCTDAASASDVERLDSITSVTLNQAQATEWRKDQVVVTGHSDGRLCLWAYTFDATRCHYAVAPRATYTTSDCLVSVLLTSDEKKLYTGDAQGYLALWATSTCA